MPDSSGRTRTVRAKRDEANEDAESEPRRESVDGLLSTETITARFGPFVDTDATAALVDRVHRWWDAGEPVHIVGPTGCGKTALAAQAAAARERPAVWLSGDEAVDTAALTGEHAGEKRYRERDQYVPGVVKETSVVSERWVDNPLSVAAREGATLVYNEFSRSKPAANNVLLSAFEEGILERPSGRGSNRTVDVHPEFRVVLTSNSEEYAGIHRPQDALLDRLVGVHLDFYDRETEVEIVDVRVDELERESIEKVVDIVRALREELDVTVSTRAAVVIARGLAAFPADDDVVVDVCTDVLASKVSSRTELDDLRDDIDAIVGES